MAQKVSRFMLIPKRYFGNNMTLLMIVFILSIIS